MFRGRYEHTIDAKGRTSFPSKFRDVLAQRGESKLVLTTGLEACLVAYPMKEWLRFEEKLAALPQFDSDVAMLRRIVVSGAVECDLDRLGRLVIPAGLRELVMLDKEALWAGMGHYIELWPKERFSELRNEALADTQKKQLMAQRLSELGL